MSARNPLKNPRPPLRVLHLEDDPTDAELVERQLKSHGIDCWVTRVATRADFYRRLSDGKFDLILSDSNLPSFDGFAALKIASTIASTTPFVFVSGEMAEALAKRACLQGAFACVAKSEPEKLVEALKQASTVRLIACEKS
jgi:CheY-like chemotaxis protein